MKKGGAYYSFSKVVEDIKKQLNYEGEVVISSINVDYDSEAILIRYYTDENTDVKTVGLDFCKLDS